MSLIPVWPEERPILQARSGFGNFEQITSPYFARTAVFVTKVLNRASVGPAVLAGSEGMLVDIGEIWFLGHSDRTPIRVLDA